jgi:hypothetical protein
MTLDELNIMSKANGEWFREKLDKNVRNYLIVFFFIQVFLILLLLNFILGVNSYDEIHIFYCFFYLLNTLLLIKL